MTPSGEQPGDAAFRPPRRSSTVPVMPRRSSTSSVPSQDPKHDEVVETLYSHPAVKIIAFMTNERVSIGHHTETKPGSLQPSSRLERTIAIGPFRIYKAPGSVAFLSCGSALQPILPKSQCWCLAEDNSCFVLQIRRPQYWRIELPVDEPDDQERAIVLREVLSRALQFERTECPFERDFEVELPDGPTTPVKLKAWSAEGKNLIASPFAERLADAQTPIAMAGLREARPSSQDGEHWRPQPFDLNTTPTRRLRRSNTEDSLSLTSARTQVNQNHLVEQVVNTLEASKVVTTPQRDGRHRRTGSGVRPFTPVSQEGTPKTQEPLRTGRSRAVSEDIASGWFARSPEAGSTSATTSPPNKAVHNLVDGFDSLYTNGRDPGDQQIGSSSRTHWSKHRGLEPHDEDEEVDESPGELSDAFFTPDERAGEDRELVTRSRESIRSSKLAHMQPKTPTQASVSKTIAPAKASLPSTPPRSAEKKAGGSAGKGKGRGDDEPSSFEGAGYVAPVNLSKKRMSKKLAGRSYTTPAQLRVATSTRARPAPSSGARAGPSTSATKDSSDTSPEGSVVSFHSVASQQSGVASLPPSPPVSQGGSPDRQPFPHPHEDIVVNKLTVPPRDSSVSTATPTATRFASNSQRRTARSRSASPRTRVPAPTSQQQSTSGETETTIQQSSQFQRRLRRDNLSFSRRALSPLPPAANLFNPNARIQAEDPLTAMKQLPGAVLSKTFELLMGPPGHLIQLMLRVARKILAGEWRGLVYGFNEGGEEIPVQWDYSDEECSSSEDSADEREGGRDDRGRALSTHWDEQRNSRHWDVD